MFHELFLFPLFLLMNFQPAKLLPTFPRPSPARPLRDLVLVTSQGPDRVNTRSWSGRPAEAHPSEFRAIGPFPFFIHRLQSFQTPHALISACTPAARCGAALPHIDVHSALVCGYETNTTPNAGRLRYGDSSSVPSPLPGHAPVRKTLAPRGALMSSQPLMAVYFLCYVASTLMHYSDFFI